MISDYVNDWIPPDNPQWTTTRRKWQDPNLKYHYWELTKNWKATGIIVKDFTKYPDCEIFDWDYINTKYGSEDKPMNKKYTPNYTERLNGEKQ